MTKANFEIWLQGLKSAWEQKSPEKIFKICAPNIEYFENPFQKPARSPKEVKKIWIEVPETQKNIKFKFDIISVNKDFGVTHWSASLTRVPADKKDFLDGIFIVYLNNEGLCTKFRQWWVIK